MPSESVSHYRFFLIALGLATSAIATPSLAQDGGVGGATQVIGSDAGLAPDASGVLGDALAPSPSASPLKADIKAAPLEGEEIVIPPPPAALRAKPRSRLRSTLGGRDEDVDMGSEADSMAPVGGAADDGSTGTEFRASRWTFNIRGVLRMPARVAWGPRGDGQPGVELHQPRLIANSTTEWNFVSLPRGANNGFVLIASSGNVGATFGMIASNSTTTGGWADLTAIPSFMTGSLFIRFPDALGSLGGLTARAGVLNLKYGMAGTSFASSGYYGTYQFGRLQGPGAVVTSDLYFGEKWAMLVEGGASVAPAAFTQSSFYTKSLPLPTVERPSSSYALHAHASLEQGKRLRFGLHYIENWAPNEGASLTERDSASPRLRVYGGDFHIRDRNWGDGYLGFTRIDARNLDKPLGELVEVVHHRGSDLLEYFNNPNFSIPNPTGTIHSLQTQYTYSFSSLAGKGSYLQKHQLAASLFGMYTRGTSPVPPGTENYLGMPFRPGSARMLKFGGDVQFSPFAWMQVMLQFDHVRPDLTANSTAITDLSWGGFKSWILPRDTDASNGGAFSVLQPKVILKRGSGSNAYLVIGYAHFFMAPFVGPISPQNRSNRRADTDLISVVAYMRI